MSQVTQGRQGDKWEILGGWLCLSSMNTTSYVCGLETGLGLVKKRLARKKESLMGVYSVCD